MYSPWKFLPLACVVIRTLLVCLCLASRLPSLLFLCMLMTLLLLCPQISAVFDTYSLFEKASGSRLNLGKCRGLWLGSWQNCSDSPVAIDWSNKMIKVLGVFIGFGDLDEANWRPRIDAVSKCLTSWSSRSLSLSGKALVANALALSRVWYVASLVHMPRGVLKELNSLLFGCFWSGKKDKVNRKVVVQPKDCGGFAVVSIELKVQALLVQWFRRFVILPNSWVSLLTYWCFDRFGIDPSAVNSSPSTFILSRLPRFYESLFRAWCGVLAAPLASCPSADLVISGPLCPLCLVNPPICVC